MHVCRLGNRRRVFMCQHLCFSNNVDTQYEQAAVFLKGKRARTTAVGTVLWWRTGIFVIVWWFNPHPHALSSHLLPPLQAPTHTHTFLLTPAWPLTPLRINMCNSGEILHYHGNRASCPIERRTANCTVWFSVPPPPLILPVLQELSGSVELCWH